MIASELVVWLFKMRCFHSSYCTGCASTCHELTSIPCEKSSNRINMPVSMINPRRKTSWWPCCIMTKRTKKHGKYCNQIMWRRAHSGMTQRPVGESARFRPQLSPLAGLHCSPSSPYLPWPQSEICFSFWCFFCAPFHQSIFPCAATTNILPTHFHLTLNILPVLFL